MPKIWSTARVWMSSVRQGQAVFTSLQILCALLALYLWLHTPAPGYSVGCLAVVAVLMSLHADMHPAHKALWILVAGVLLIIEFRAINKDRKDNQEQQACIRAQEAQSFESILDQEKRNLAAISTQQEDSFRATVSMLIAAQRQDRSQFQTLLATQQALFDHEQALVESLSGKLVPASDPTPNTACGDMGSDDVLILLGDTNAAMTNNFPHAIMQVHGRDVISVDKDLGGTVVINMEIRGVDNKIIARLDRSGFVVNRNSELQVLRPDRSTLTVEDEYGTRVLYARFMNPRVIALRGIMRAQGLGIPIDIPYATHSCSAHGGRAEIGIQ
jgi:hypothetical protein